MKQLMHACVAEHEKEIRMDGEASEENSVTVNTKTGVLVCRMDGMELLVFYQSWCQS